MYLDQLKSWISERLPKGTKSLTTSIRNSKVIQEYLVKYTQEHENITFSARANIIYNDCNRPVCPVCGKHTYFNRNRWEFGETCSAICAANNIRRNNQIKETSLKKYGVDNYSKTDEFKERVKNTCLEKYGVDSYKKTKEFQEKSKATCIEKYGIDNYAKTEESKIRHKNTCMKKYGVDSFTKTKEFQEKSKATCIEKYGVSHQMQNLEVFEKQQKNSYYYKDYTLPSGKIVRIQGYEHIALDELLSIYDESDLLISNKDIFKEFGAFEYTNNGKKHRYFPDIFVKPLNCFIEVKSTRTYAVNKEKNLLKRDSILQRNYGFKFWIYGYKTKKIV